VILHALGTAACESVTQPDEGYKATEASLCRQFQAEAAPVVHRMQDVFMLLADVAVSERRHVDLRARPLQ
jgi:hypothetical protein